MSRIKDGNFYVVQSWMVKPPYSLKGTELSLYAIIYGFSQAENQRFTGSLQYLAEWTGSTRQSVQANLKSLCKKGFLQKFEYENNNVKFCEYRASILRGVQNFCTPTQKICTGGVQKICTGGVQKICPNNIYNNTSNNNIADNPDADDLRQKSLSELEARKREIIELMDSGSCSDDLLPEFRAIINRLAEQSMSGDGNEVSV